MTPKEENDLFYVCSMIEYLGRKTKNKRNVIVDCLGEAGIRKQLYDAEVNHCLSFGQVSDELIEQYQIPQGDFDTVSDCKYTLPSETDIGGLYRTLIMDCAQPGREVEELMQVFRSFISEKISNFNSDLYYQNPSYLKYSYQAGYLLD